MRNQGKDPITLELGNIFFRPMKASADQKDALLAFSDLIARADKNCKLDAVVPGPKDFAFGWQNLKKWLDIIGAPVLGGNLIDAKTEKPLFKDSLIIERDGRKVGLFGLITSDLNTMGISDLKFRIDDPSEYAARIFQQLKGKADIIIALSILNDSEISKLTEAVPDLKYILRGNAKGVVGRRNQAVGNAVTMATPSRGKYLGVLKFVGKGNVLDFSDITEKQNIQRRIDNYNKQVDKMLKAAKASSVEDFKANLSPEDKKLVRFNRYYSKLESYKRDIKRFDKIESYFQLDRVMLDKRVKDDPTVKKMVDEAIKEYGEPGKVQRKKPTFSLKQPK